MQHFGFIYENKNGGQYLLLDEYETDGLAPLLRGADDPWLTERQRTDDPSFMRVMFQFQPIESPRFDYPGNDRYAMIDPVFAPNPRDFRRILSERGCVMVELPCTLTAALAAPGRSTAMPVIVGGSFINELDGADAGHQWFREMLVEVLRR